LNFRKKRLGMGGTFTTFTFQKMRNDYRGNTQAQAQAQARALSNG
jgi:hypothetical protein